MSPTSTYVAWLTLSVPLTTMLVQARSNRLFAIDDTLPAPTRWSATAEPDASNRINALSHHARPRLRVHSPRSASFPKLRTSLPVMHGAAACGQTTARQAALAAGR